MPMETKSSAEAYLESAYLEAAEWNMATLEELCSIKSSSKHRIERQKSICTKMLVICASFKTPKVPHLVTRTTRIVEESKTSGKPIADLVTEYADRVRSL